MPSYADRIRRLLSDPEQLEQLYRQAVKKGETEAFAAAIHSLRAEMPDNLLLAAWHYRLAAEETPTRRGRLRSHWLWAILLSIPCGLVFWWLSGDYYVYERGWLPWLIFIWAPISAGFILVFLALAGQHRSRRLAIMMAGLAFVSAYAYFATRLIDSVVFRRQYVNLGAIHLILMAWAAVGFYVLTGQGDHESRFAFFIKSLEAVVMGGLFGVVVFIFSSISMGLFGALGIDLPDLLTRLFLAGGMGLIPVLAVAMVYDPLLAMREQNFRAGLSSFIATLLRIFLPLAIIVLLVYVGFIPFRFTEPFYEREVLVIYNVMLFAVIALLLGVTPVLPEVISETSRRWLRRGEMLLALLAEIVSLHALAAIIFRTWWDGFTPNRVTVIGWNLVNIGLLGVLLYRQWKAGESRWLAETHRTFAQAAWPYLGLGLALLLGLPLVF